MLDWFCRTPELRRKGMMKDVLPLFTDYVLTNYPQIAFFHSMTFKGNVPAQQLLLSCGFKKDDTERLSTEHIFFLKERE